MPPRGSTGKLKVGDVIRVHNPLLRKDIECLFPVTKIDGNQAKTDFRTFSIWIYTGGHVYEYRKRPSRYYNNTYTVELEYMITKDA